MSDTVWAAVIGGVAGLGTGVLGSLLGPWSQWGVDKRRDRRASRKVAVERWRAGLAAWDAEVEAQPGITDHRPPLHTHKWFSSLSRHLPSDVIEGAKDWDTVRPNTLYAHPPGSAKRRSSLGRDIQNAIDGLAEKWDVYE